MMIFVLCVPVAFFNWLQ